VKPGHFGDDKPQNRRPILLALSDLASG